MDIEKLIEQLRENTDCWKDKVHGYANIRLDAATALSTLQAENEKLRAEADGMRSNWYKAVEEVKKLRAELERMKKIMRDDGIMVIPSKYPGGRSEWNIPKPRG